MDGIAFREYLSAFNGADYDAMVRYYSEDVTFSFANGITLTGRDGVIAFYRPFHAAVKETVDILFLVMDSVHVAVELAAEFRALKDYDGFPRGPLKAGDIVRIISFVHYDLDAAGRFSQVRDACLRSSPAPFPNAGYRFDPFRCTTEASCQLGVRNHTLGYMETERVEKCAHARAAM